VRHGRAFRRGCRAKFWRVGRLGLTSVWGRERNRRRFRPHRCACAVVGTGGTQDEPCGRHPNDHSDDGVGEPQDRLLPRRCAARARQRP